MVPRPTALPDDVFVPRSSSAVRAPRARKHLGALVAATITSTAALASAPLGASTASATPEQLTLAIAWTGTQVAAVPPLIDRYTREHRSVHWNVIENVTEQKLLAEERGCGRPARSRPRSLQPAGNRAGRGRKPLHLRGRPAAAPARVLPTQAHRGGARRG